MHYNVFVKNLEIRYLRTIYSNKYDTSGRICPSSLSRALFIKGVGANPSKGKIFYNPKRGKSNVRRQDFNLQRMWR